MKSPGTRVMSPKILVMSPEIISQVAQNNMSSRVIFLSLVRIPKKHIFTNRWRYQSIETRRWKYGVFTYVTNPSKVKCHCKCNPFQTFSKTSNQHRQCSFKSTYDLREYCESAKLVITSALSRRNFVRWVSGRDWTSNSSPTYSQHCRACWRGATSLSITRYKDDYSFD